MYLSPPLMVIAYAMALPEDIISNAPSPHDLMKESERSCFQGEVYASLGTQSGEEVVAEEGLDFHWAAAGVRLGQAPDALRLEVESVLKSGTPAVLHVRVSRDDALVEAGIGTEILLWVFSAWAAVALPWLRRKT